MADYLGLNWERDDLGGGKYRHTQYARPIAYPTNGTYEAITNGLVPTGVPAFPVGVDELLTTRFAAFTAGISPIWYAGYGLSMVQLSVVGCNNGVDAQWTQGENTIIYPEILDNADLTLTVANHLVQAAWRLKTGHPSTITWRMNENAGFDPDALTFGDDFFFSQPILKKAGETDIPLTWDVSQQGEIYFLACEMPDGDWAGWTLDPTLTLQPDASSGIDTFAKEDDANTNKGTSTQIEIRNTAGARRHGLLKFSGISSIPAGASIDSATLSLWSNRQVSADIVTSFHSILVANSGWTESGATWNYAVASSTRWAGDTGNDGGTDAGCSVSGTDYNSTQMGTFTYSSGTPTGTEHQASLNTSQVEAWLTANYGMVILQDASNFMYWRSSDHATAATRPKLVIEYTVGGAVQALHHYRMRRVA